MQKSDEVILSLYSKYSDEELLSIIESTSSKYSKLINSEKEATAILLNYNLYFKKQHELFKRSYLTLLKCAELRNLNYHNKIITSQIDSFDVIERIKENFLAEIANINEYYHIYDGYCGNNTWNVQNFKYEPDTTGADIKISETYDLYKQIIEEVSKDYSKAFKKQKEDKNK